MEILSEITTVIICAVFLLSIIGSIILFMAVNKMNSYKKLFSIEHQDLI